MKVQVAKRAGFCWGVRRAMDAAVETLARHGHQGVVQTLGPLIHNPQALDHLARRGVQQASTLEAVVDGTVVIRAHGIPKADWQQLIHRRNGGALRITNGTCPEVARVQATIQRHAANGGFTIILGQATHAEVIAHRSFAVAGWAVVDSLEAAIALPDSHLDGALVVAQTTFSLADFRAIVDHLRQRKAHLTIRNTICPDTVLRQSEATEMVRKVDAVVVIGGHGSNNTRHLVELARQTGKPVQWVECASELDLDGLKDQGEVGVLAGASTPTWTVDEVVETLEHLGRTSWQRTASRFSQTLQLPLALGLGGLTLILHRALGWHSGWAGPMLPAAFHTSLCAVLPYLDAYGLDRKGQVHGHFLAKHRAGLLGFAAVTGCAALAAAAVQGPLCLWGAILLATMGAAKLKFSPHGSPGIHNVPGLKDLAQALAPAILAIGLPGAQRANSTGLQAMAALTVLCLALATHSLRHLHAFHEDRILGKEILPVAIGSQATRWLAAALLAGALGSLVSLEWVSVR